LILSTGEETHRKEADFHDAWAESAASGRVDVDAAFESPLALENRFILGLLGDLRGKRLLDVGAGLGESSVYFAKRGADVTATDISPKMLELAESLARQHGVSISTKVAASESASFEPDSFDVVYIANTIHHSTDKSALIRNAYRYLKPGGIFVSWDPLRYNPVINIYRRMATEVRTEDERPLDVSDFKLIQNFFPDARSRFFWITGLAIFGKYYLIDRVHPNADRYWKRIYRETNRSVAWWRPLGWIDAVLTRIPGVRWLSWNVVIHARKPVGR
jgi:SAM-dependent methyltransferase